MSGSALPISDLDRIQTCNLLSRNQMRYSVAPRGHCCSCFTDAKVRPFLKPANFFTTFSQIIFFLLYLHSPAEGVFILVILNVKYRLLDFIGVQFCRTIYAVIFAFIAKSRYRANHSCRSTTKSFF